MDRRSCPSRFLRPAHTGIAALQQPLVRPFLQTLPSAQNPAGVLRPFDEKHITLNKKSKGPDHFFAIEVNELNKMVKTIRRIEKLAGSFYKSRLKSENTVYINCFSKNNLKKGSVIKLDKILFKRDFVKGVQAHETKKIINKKLKRNLIANERIETKHYN